MWVSSEIEGVFGGRCVCLPEGEMGEIMEAPEIMTDRRLTVFDYWAPWCGPCRMFAPIFDELAKKYEGKVSFVKFNVDDPDQGMIAHLEGIRSVPTFAFVKNGIEVERFSGTIPKVQFEAKIESHLGP